MTVMWRVLGSLAKARPVVRQLAVIVLFFEVGAVLLLVPWKPYWEQNYFLESRPYLHAIATNPFVRGAVSGLGLVNLLAGLAELASLFMSASSGPPPADVVSSSVSPRPASTDDH